MLVDEKGKAELEKEIRLCTDDRLRVKLQAIRLAYTGVHRLEEIAKLTGRARSMVVRYMDAFREKGVVNDNYSYVKTTIRNELFVCLKDREKKKSFGGGRRLRVKRATE